MSNPGRVPEVVESSPSREPPWAAAWRSLNDLVRVYDQLNPYYDRELTQVMQKRIRAAQRLLCAEIDEWWKACS